MSRLLGHVHSPQGGRPTGENAGKSQCFLITSHLRSQVAMHQEHLTALYLPQEGGRRRHAQLLARLLVGFPSRGVKCRLLTCNGSAQKDPPRHVSGRDIGHENSTEERDENSPGSSDPGAPRCAFLPSQHSGMIVSFRCSPTGEENMTSATRMISPCQEDTFRPGFG